MKEEWRPIRGYTGYYEASNLGRVRSLDRVIRYNRKGKQIRMPKAGRILKVNYFNGTIPYVLLCKNKMPVACRLATLIAKAWVPNPNKYPYVIHKDFDRCNNCADNLEWSPYLRIHNIDKEDWRAIPGYEDLYQVSSKGKVRSIPRKVERNRSHGKLRIKDTPEYVSRELTPCRYNKKNDMPVYHLHRRIKDGYYGQTDEYFKSEDLIMLAFPELYKGEN